MLGFSAQAAHPPLGASAGGTPGSTEIPAGGSDDPDSVVLPGIAFELPPGGSFGGSVALAVPLGLTAGSALAVPLGLAAGSALAAGAVVAGAANAAKSSAASALFRVLEQSPVPRLPF
ncbi:MAG: hypothetical protein L6Q76_33330, partial [Polyangiaceae bacterium]|nr:hypothetical protein [Polyangiaceae bacterium]